MAPAPSILVLLSGSPHLIASLREQTAQRVTHVRRAHCFLLPCENTVHKSYLQKGVYLGYGSRGRVQDSRDQHASRRLEQEVGRLCRPSSAHAVTYIVQQQCCLLNVL